MYMYAFSCVQKVENGDFNWIVPGERNIPVFFVGHVT